MKRGPCRHLAWWWIGVFFAASACAADVNLFQDENFGGQRVEISGPVTDLSRMAFNDSANSAVIERGSWQVCVDADFQGACVTIGPGRYASLRQMGMDNRVSSLRPATFGPSGTGSTHTPVERAAAVFFLHEGFQGAAVGLDGAAPDFRALDTNDKASSLIVRRGHWQVCHDIEFRGRCVVFGPGRYPSMRPFELNDTISSARPGGDPRQAVGAELLLFEHDNFDGRRVASSGDMADFGAVDFAHRVSSVVIEGGTWQLCSEPHYRGQCIVLGPGRHPSMRAHGLNDAIASARRTTLTGGGAPGVVGAPPGALPPLAAPVFKQVMTFGLEHFRIPPTGTKRHDLPITW